MKKLYAIFFIGLLFSCSSEVSKTEEDSSSKSIKIAMMPDLGGVNDQSFNQSAWAGISKIQSEGLAEISYLESNQEADYRKNLELFYDRGNDIIWGIGFKTADYMLEAATNNIDKKYAIIDFSYGDKAPSNITSVVFKAEEGAFLVGYIAGKMTKTNKIGFIGGIKGFIVDAFHYGFEAGVMYANKDAIFVSQYADSFSDIAKGKSIANLMYSDNADIVFHAAGPLGIGLSEAAKENKKWAIGVDMDQSYLAPDNFLTSSMKRIDIATYDISKRIINGENLGGQTIVYGLKEDGVGIAPTSNKHVPQNILDEVEMLKQDVIDGKIVVPSNEEQMLLFKQNY